MRVYAIRRTDGDYLGRLNLGDPLRPVPQPFAYTWNTREEAARNLAAYANDGEVVEL